MTKGHAEFAYAAVDPDPAIGGAIVALHEFGRHLLGLDDEYNRAHGHVLTPDSGVDSTH